MTVDPSTPVLVGVGAQTQRTDDPADAVEAVELMWAAVEAADRDTGAPGLAQQAGLVAVPKGIWGYADPGRIIADRLGATARTVLADVGVLQQSLLTRAADTIASGAADVVVVCGGEAKHRALRAAIAGAPADEFEQPDGTRPPTSWRRPPRRSCRRSRSSATWRCPHQYAIIDRALASADGLTTDDHRGRLGAALGRVRPSGRHPPRCVGIAARPTPPRSPRPLRRTGWWPAPTRNCSARSGTSTSPPHSSSALRRPPSGRAFLAIAGCSRSAQPSRNVMVPLSRRADLHRSVGFELGAAQALAAIGAGIDDVDLSTSTAASRRPCRCRRASSAWPSTTREGSP